MLIYIHIYYGAREWGTTWRKIIKKYWSISASTSSFLPQPPQQQRWAPSNSQYITLFHGSFRCTFFLCCTNNPHRTSRLTPQVNAMVLCARRPLVIFSALVIRERKFNANAIRTCTSCKVPLSHFFLFTGVVICDFYYIFVSFYMLTKNRTNFFFSRGTAMTTTIRKNVPNALENFHRLSEELETVEEKYNFSLEILFAQTPSAERSA